MQVQAKKLSNGTRLRTQENAYLLSSLMAAIQSQGKNPLVEHKANAAPTPRDSKVSKFSFNETGLSTYAPKSTTAVTLKSYLKKNLNHTTTLAASEDPKSKTTICSGGATAAKPNTNVTEINNCSASVAAAASGNMTQRGKAALKGSFHDSESHKEPSKTFRMSHGAVMPAHNKTISPERASFGKPEGKEKPSNKPSKNLTINTSAEVSADALKSSQLKCLTARNMGLEPTDLGNDVPLQSAASISIPNYEPSKCSLKSNGVVKAYAATTNQGLVRYGFCGNSNNA